MKQHEVRTRGFVAAATSPKVSSSLARALEKARAKAAELRAQVETDMAERKRTIDGIRDKNVKAAARGGDSHRKSVDSDS